MRMKKRFESPEARARSAATARKRWENPNTREQFLARVTSEEHKTHCRENLKRINSDPILRAKGMRWRNDPEKLQAWKNGISETRRIPIPEYADHLGEMRKVIPFPPLENRDTPWALACAKMNNEDRRAWNEAKARGEITETLRERRARLAKLHAEHILKPTGLNHHNGSGVPELYPTHADHHDEFREIVSKCFNAPSTPWEVECTRLYKRNWATTGAKPRPELPTEADHHGELRKVIPKSIPSRETPWERACCVLYQRECKALRKKMKNGEISEDEFKAIRKANRAGRGTP